MHEGKFHLPFVYGLERTRDPVTLRPIYVEDTASKRHPIGLFVPGDAYELWGVFPGNIHLFGVRTEPDVLVPLFILGSDALGHDLLSRIFFGARISLTVGLLGVFLAFFLGLLLGGIAGFFGGVADEIIMRIIDVLLALPTIPLWMSLAAALPQDWPQLKTYFYVTVILSIFGWTILARVRARQIAQPARRGLCDGSQAGWRKRGADHHTLHAPRLYQLYHRLTDPGHPKYDPGRDILSFLGVGLRAPTISWGVMLQDAQNLQTVAQTPWLLWPVAFVIVAVLMFNFLGDGLRDAADPYVTG